MENNKHSHWNHFRKSKLGATLILSFIFTIIGTIHSVFFNESRLIVPTDLNTYVFRPEDLIFGVPLTIFIFSVCFATIYYPIKLFKQDFNTGVLVKYRLGEYTPKIGKYRWFGCVGGLLGFIPLIPDTSLPLSQQFYNESNYEMVFFFLFFAQFACYFQHKFSDILIDERFLFNVAKAEAKAYRTAFFTIVVVFLLAFPRLNGTALNTLLLAVIALSFSASQVLKAYYLYLFDMEE